MPLNHTYACLRVHAAYNYKAHNPIGNIYHVHVTDNYGHVIVVSFIRYI